MKTVKNGIFIYYTPFPGNNKYEVFSHEAMQEKQPTHKNPPSIQHFLLQKLKLTIRSYPSGVPPVDVRRYDSLSVWKEFNITLISSQYFIRKTTWGVPFLLFSNLWMRPAEWRRNVIFKGRNECV